MHPVLQVRLQQCRAERVNPFPRPAGNVDLSAPQGTVVFPGCLGTLLTHAQFAVDPDPQPLSVGLFSGVPSSRQCVSPGLPHSQVQNEAFVLVMLHAVVLTQFSNLFTFLCKPSPPSVEATAPPNLVSTANLLKTSSRPACKSFTKTLEMGNSACDCPPA